jgi:hypothetical protein
MLLASCASGLNGWFLVMAGFEGLAEAVVIPFGALIKHAQTLFVRI